VGATRTLGTELGAEGTGRVYSGGEFANSSFLATIESLPFNPTIGLAAEAAATMHRFAMPSQARLRGLKKADEGRLGSRRRDFNRQLTAHIRNSPEAESHPAEAGSSVMHLVY